MQVVIWFIFAGPLRPFPPSFRYPTQKEWERKEQLYLNVIDLLERGKHWEHAIPLTKELADVYERRVFNYRKLVSYQRHHWCVKSTSSGARGHAT